MLINQILDKPRDHKNNGPLDDLIVNILMRFCWNQKGNNLFKNVWLVHVSSTLNHLSYDWLSVCSLECSKACIENVLVILSLIDFFDLLELILNRVFFFKASQVLDSEPLLTCFFDNGEYPAEPNFIVPFGISHQRWTLREVNFSLVCFWVSLWFI